ncbi:MAG: hypothetical protein ACKV2O_19780 [Acidimicrobiales bacterium]
MITTGAKFYFGLGFALVLGAVLYGWTSGGVDWDLFPGALGTLYFQLLGSVTLGYKGGVGDHVGYGILLGGAAVSITIGGFLVAFRDADDKPLAEVAGLSEAPPLRPVASPNHWAPLSAFAVALAAIGLATSGWFLLAGAVLGAVAMLEWAFYAWSDRASGDERMNAQLRAKLLNPIEVPLFGVLVAGFVAFGISRVFLAVPKLGATWLFMGIASVIFVIAIGLAAAPKVPRQALSALLVLGAIGVLAGGIAGTAAGEREFHDESEGSTIEGGGGTGFPRVYGTPPTTTAAEGAATGAETEGGH